MTSAMKQRRRKTRRYNVTKLFDEQARRGWTDTRLAAIASLSPATVGRVRLGHTQRVSTVKALADALGVEIGELVDAAEARP